MYTTFLFKIVIMIDIFYLSMKFICVFYYICVYKMFLE